ncbi:MAG: SBBP repeat-containing protein [Bacteroidetes bacterium]|nr:SBBP repeat-containing protein [Bacteroidota bacterium]
MKKLLFMLLLLSNANLLRSQSELHIFTEWASSAGSQNFFHKSRTKTDGSGNVYVAGATVNSSGNYDILVAKYNSSGVQQWIQQYNGYENYHDFATEVCVDGSGNVYITGTVSDSSSVQGSDIITNKYNSSGTLQWSARYNGSGNFYDSGADIIVDASGNVYITGGTYTSTSMPYSNGITIKYNSSGTQQWATLYNNATYNLSEVGAKIIFNGSTKVSVAGAIQTGLNTYSYGRLDYNISTGVQSGGVILGTGTSNIDQVGDFVQDANLNSYIAGATYDSVGGTGYNYYIMKLDSTLAMQWERTYNGASNLDDMANGIKVDPWGNVYVTGYSTSSTQKKNIVTRKYNSAGSVIWTQTYNDTLNGDDAGMAMAMDASGNICIAGYDSTVLGSTNYLAIKYDTSGAQQWIIRYDGIKHLKDMATDVCIDNNGDFVVTGMSETAPATYEYVTIKYVEKNITTPTDALGENPQTGFDYFENKGQLIAADTTLIPDVKYYCTSMQPALYFKNNSYSMVFAHADTTTTPDTLHRIDVEFNKVNPNAKTYAMEEQEYFNNYYLGHIPQGISQVHSNKRLVTTDLYTNIDVEYSSNQNGLKYYFVIKPGAFPNTIEMEYTGASSFNLDGSTNALTINSSVGSITYGRPTVYQVNSSNIVVPITGWTADWQTNGASNKYKFNVGVYDSTKTLIIMVSGISYPASPAGSNENLCWSTYFGGGNEDYITGVDVDDIGSQFITGFTFSDITTFPPLPGAFQPNLKVGYDAFLAKFRTNHYLHWGTYLGGTQNDVSNDVRVRKYGNKNPYIVGSTPSADFKYFSKVGAHNDSTLGGVQDGFIAEFDNNSGNRKWITYFGGTGNDQLFSLDFDTADRMFITGRTNSSSGIVSVVPSGAYTQSYAGVMDAFIARFTPADNYDWYTPYGGSGFDEGVSVKVDIYNNVFIYGNTSSPTGSGALPTTNPSGAADYYDNSLGGAQDVFIAKFSFGGTPQWGTYIGGDSLEAAGSNALAFNSHNDIYIGGLTLSNNFPMKNSSAFFDNAFTGADGFLTKFNGANYDTLWSTYISGNSYPNNINVTSIAINGDNEVFLGGITEDLNFPLMQLTSFFYQDTMFGAFGNTDGFLMTFNELDQQILGTYYGGHGLGYQEQIIDMAIFNDYLYAVGVTNTIETNSVRSFPLFNPGLLAYYDSTYNGGMYDGFVSMFCINSVVGINEFNFTNNSSANFFVYPNPTIEQLTIKLKKALKENAIIELYSIDGKLLYSYILLNHQESISIDVSKLSQGLYLLRIKNDELNSSIKFSKH